MGAFLYNFFQDWLFYACHHSSFSRTYTQYEGVQQGCVFSTTPFMLAVNGIVLTLPGLHMAS